MKTRSAADRSIRKVFRLVCSLIALALSAAVMVLAHQGHLTASGAVVVPATFFTVCALNLGD